MMMMMAPDGRPMSAAPEVIIEKEFVDRIIEVEKIVGVSEEKVKEIKEQAERERQALVNKQREEREMMQKGVERTEEEKQKLVRVCHMSKPSFVACVYPSLPCGRVNVVRRYVDA